MNEFLFILNSMALGAGLAMDAFSVSLANGLAEPGMKTRKMAGVAGVFGFYQAAMPMLGWVLVHTVLSYFAVLERVIPFLALGLLSVIGGKMIFDSLRHSRKETTGKLPRDMSAREKSFADKPARDTSAREKSFTDKPVRDKPAAASLADSSAPLSASSAEAAAASVFAAPLSGFEEAPPRRVLGLGTLLLQGLATSIDALSVGVTIGGYDAFHAALCAALTGIVTFVIAFCGLFLGKKFGVRLAGKAELIGGLLLCAIGLEIFLTGVL